MTNDPLNNRIWLAERLRRLDEVEALLAHSICITMSAWMDLRASIARLESIAGELDGRRSLALAAEIDVLRRVAHLLACCEREVRDE